MAEERRPLTREQAIILAWSRKRGVEPPPGLRPDSDGFLHGSCIKYGLGQPNEDDVALIGRMTELGYAVKTSKDNLRWEWSIHVDAHQENMRKQHEKALMQTNPKKNEVVDTGEEGYYDLPSTYSVEPVSLDKLFNSGPANPGAYESAAAATGD